MSTPAPTHGCSYKRRYETRGEAMRHAAHIKRERSHVLGEPDLKLRAYRCAECLGYHLTSRAPREPNSDQDRTIQYLNDSWGVTAYECQPDGSVIATTDDGDVYTISTRGKFVLVHDARRPSN